MEKMLGMVVHILNTRTREAEAGVSLRVGVSLIYTASSKMARATWRDPVLNKTKPHIRE